MNLKHILSTHIVVILCTALQAQNVSYTNNAFGYRIRQALVVEILKE